ncbi:MAG: hypothetical protein GFH27_549283n418 [Chloroflexi bacterium AL-W]|nr:hypothetical protein [Chloroflexi bacterium AL-N1]NOK64461.1 hypothetical protein [Chloroflexi bacterium AL-N10]NOK75703.1 hypothetical protein [Chloroflexi bacterium AL-N5]NOK80539.1 hypothetical protein [Chloroflexi bacterium AL-W]NOK87053.1 hypothetical protein [Chloroflexi bacterium AL-N15]
MKNYLVRALLYDREEQRYIEPGNTIELDDDRAAILLQYGAIALIVEEQSNASQTGEAPSSRPKRKPTKRGT